MKKAMAVMAIVMMLAGCAALQQFVTSNAEQLNQLATYYEQFSAGVKQALPALATLPGAAGYASAAALVVGVMDEGVNALKWSATLASAGMPDDDATLAAQKEQVYGLTQSLNALVGKAQALVDASKG